MKPIKIKSIFFDANGN